MSGINSCAATMQQNVNEHAAKAHSQAVAMRDLQETNESLTQLAQNLTTQIANLSSNSRNDDNGRRQGGGRGRGRGRT